MLLLDTKVRINDNCTEPHFVGLTGTVKENRSLCHPYVNRVEFDAVDEGGHWFADWELDVIKEEAKMLTPYEFGRETGRIQAKFNRERSIDEIRNLAGILGFRGDAESEFCKGSRIDSRRPKRSKSQTKTCHHGSPALRSLTRSRKI